jgi:endonuclease/exonuclease/phosphatase family metal-dependent hydrolase
MTFNAEFLWDGVEPEEGNADFPWKSSQTEAEEHMSRIAEVIIRNNPDIVNLVEVENLQALTSLNTKFLAGRGYVPYLVNGTDTATGQDVGLLTRIDPDGSQIQRYTLPGSSGNISKTVSKNYFAKMSIGDLRLALVGFHFLAFPDSPSRRLERQAQADAMRDLAVQLRSEGFHPVLMGDFNDYDALTPDHQNSTPITTVLATLRGLDPGDTADDLTNAAEFVPQGQRYTGHWDQNENEHVEFPQELTSIDHILMPQPTLAMVASVNIDQTHDPVTVSDHFPIIVTLNLAGGPGPTTGVRLTRLIPNPPGNDSLLEEITIKNIGSASVSVEGWRIRDLVGQSWTLDSLGTLQPNGEKTIRRNGQPMALNNNGDTVDLLNPLAQIVQTVTYGHVDEGEVVIPNP